MIDDFEKNHTENENRNLFDGLTSVHIPDMCGMQYTVHAAVYADCMSAIVSSHRIKTVCLQAHSVHIYQNAGEIKRPRVENPMTRYHREKTETP